MEWISIKDKLPEDIFKDNIEHDEWNGDEYIECLVHTNLGYMVTKRYHNIHKEAFEYEPGVIGSRMIDNGWYWFIEIGNNVKLNPIWVDYWGIIPEIPKK